MPARFAPLALLGLALCTGPALSQGSDSPGAVTCEDLQWSTQVLAANPDIGESCFGVYEKDGRLYALSRVEVVRVRGNNITFRPLHTDGTKGDARSLTVPAGWRAKIGGREYRAANLPRGQQLNVYLPEDRFALHFEDVDGPDGADGLIIREEVDDTPATESP